MIIDKNIANEIRSLKRQVADLQRRQLNIMNGVVQLGIDGNIKFDPDNNEINIKDKIKLKTNGTTQHEITLDDKIRLRIDGSNIYATFGANGEIKLDATNLEFNIKDKIKLKTNGTTQHEITLDDKIRLRVDGTNVYATFGANGEIKLDATNAKALFGTGGEIEINGSSKLINVGGTNYQIDGANKRSIINDGSNDRVLMGRLAGKF